MTLNELLEEADNLDVIPEAPNGIIIFPPENCNDPVTDEDSGDENVVTISNLPGRQLRTQAEIIVDKNEIQNDCEIQYDSDDDLPLSTWVPNKDKKFTSKKSKSYSWVNAELNPSFQTFSQISDNETLEDPLEIFRNFFDKTVVDMIVQFSNQYASQKNEANDITFDEIQAFIGIQLLSGYVDIPRRKMDWENLDDVHNNLVCNAISRDRFRFIMKNLHCCDNNDLDGADKYAKLRILFDMLNERFLKYAPMEENHSIDEAMVPYYGRHSCKQFIRGKPIRWGYKFWTGCTPSGYVIWFEPYQGASVSLTKYKELGLGSSIILKYADILQSRWPISAFHLFFDNFFTSLPLLDILQDRGIRGTGTIRENRVKNCPLISSVQMKKRSRYF